LPSQQVADGEGLDTANASAVIARLIVGMPRAGTTWLSQCLNQHPDVTAFGETRFWGRSFVAPDAGQLYDHTSLQRVKARLVAKPLETTIHIPGPGMMSSLGAQNIKSIIRIAFEGYISGVGPGDVFLSVAGQIARAEGKKLWVEKTPHHIYYVNRILKYLPSARFIITIRNPYSFILSYQYQRGYQRTAESRRRYEARYHPLAPALVWTRCWRATQQALRDHPDQTMLVRMEDIESNPLAVVKRVESFFMLRHNPEVKGLSAKVHSSFEDGSKPNLRDSEIAWMNLIAGAHVREAGYQAQEASIGSLAFWKSALELFPWSVRFLSYKVIRAKRGE
jgi:hypothetical protein